jgi:hypothetical protein
VTACVWIPVASSYVTLEAALCLSPMYVAKTCDLNVDAYLLAVELWANSPAGMIYGLRVDRDAGTITRAA